jgi:hypothetical protein
MEFGNKHKHLDGLAHHTRMACLCVFQRVSLHLEPILVLERVSKCTHARTHARTYAHTHLGEGLLVGEAFGVSDSACKHVAPDRCLGRRIQRLKAHGERYARECLQCERLGVRGLGFMRLGDRCLVMRLGVRRLGFMRLGDRCLGAQKTCVCRVA